MLQADLSRVEFPSWLDLDRWERVQREAVEEVVGHYEDGIPLVLLDAPTGVGKTWLGEAVRQALGTRGVYLCHSLVLQDQFEDDFPYAKVLKGRTNYVPTGARGIFRHATCGDCDKHETGEGIKECTFCPTVWTCPYEVAKSSALKADLACTNIRYFLTEANNVKHFTNLPFVTLDECDVLETELMGFVECHVSNRMRKLLGLSMPKKKTVQSAWVQWFEQSIPKVERKLTDLSPTEDDDLIQKRTFTRVTRLLNDMKRCAPQVEAGGWVYTGYQDGAVTFKPIEVSSYGTDTIWKHAERWLCMSATIISPEEFISSTGYEGAWASVEMPSPFDIKRRPVHYVPSANMTFSEKETEWPKMAKAVGRVMELHPSERILVHTNSYLLASFLQSSIADPRCKAYLDSEEREKVINWYEETADAVMLAPSLDRGYDGTDDLCRVVVVAKLPFPNIGDKQIEARLFRTRGGGQWYAVQAARSLVQMAGRGMRHEQDACTIVILDKQFERFWKEWRRGVGRSNRHLLLPDWFSEALVWGGTYRDSF